MDEMLLETPLPLSRKDAYRATCEWLLEQGRVDAAAIEAAERAAIRSGRPTPVMLNLLGSVSDEDLRDAFQAISALPVFDGERPELPPPGAELVSRTFLEAHHAVPLTGEDGEPLIVGVVDPFDEEAVAGVMFATGREIIARLVTFGEWRRAFADTGDGEETAWGDGSDDDLHASQALEFGRDAPVARRVAAWLSRAVEARASDVHVEPGRNSLIVRYRIDGALRIVDEEPLQAAASVIARIKVLADLDLGERRAPQDGRTTIVVGGRTIDVRVSIVPSVHGESAVMRILDRSSVRLSFDALGFGRAEQELLHHISAMPHGLFIVSGPTGSGKTTTLYACLETMHKTDRKILTVEDPVEFYFEHVTQVQVAPKAGVTFPATIRAFLRQDPDVILVGEIRDVETARTAVQAALTGHLVLATVHAIDSPRVIPRLVDIGVEPHQLAACFRGALAQRLVRRLCTVCRTPRPATAGELSALGATGEGGDGEPRQVWEPVGCEACGGTGYGGRMVIAEGFAASDEVGSAIREGKTQEQLTAVAHAALTKPLRVDAAEKVFAGLTSASDALRALAG